MPSCTYEYALAFEFAKDPPGHLAAGTHEAREMTTMQHRRRMEEQIAVSTEYPEDASSGVLIEIAV
jgi:hypothetical protein